MKRMIALSLGFAFGLAMPGAGVWAAADSVVMVGGQAMYPSKTIVMNAINSADHTTLVAAGWRA